MIESKTISTTQIVRQQSDICAKNVTNSGEQARQTQRFSLLFSRLIASSWQYLIGLRRKDLKVTLYVS
ncbi:hypothetical protein [Vibrio xiamenensis]|uniref:hypothetical protein n=1 Tax=Vibrio xiamenensis TaxID=861298 RepID=UPI000B874979|nr:hypothetical protein [Vibrio xiamenensis]